MEGEWEDDDSWNRLAMNPEYGGVSDVRVVCREKSRKPRRATSETG